MQKGRLTSREVEVIRQLLAERGITEYEIVGAVNEGKSLPGSTYPCEIETISGTVVTETKAYLFWLDWFNGNYTLGEHRDFWEEISLDEAGADKEAIMEAQQRLRQKGTPSS